MAATTAPIDSLRIAGTLLRLVRHLDQRIRDDMGSDIGLTELSILGAIDKGINLSSALARSLQLDPARVTRVIDNLVQRSWVDRGSDANDRRRCPLALTEDGVKQLGAGRLALTERVGFILDQLPRESHEHLIEGFEAVRQVLESPGLH